VTVDRGSCRGPCCLIEIEHRRFGFGGLLAEHLVSFVVRSQSSANHSKIFEIATGVGGAIDLQPWVR